MGPENRNNPTVIFGFLLAATICSFLVFKQSALPSVIPNKIVLNMCWHLVITSNSISMCDRNIICADVLVSCEGFFIGPKM